MSENKELSIEDAIKNKESRQYWLVYWIIFPAVFAMWTYDKLFPEECIEKAQVVDIISVEGTKATFKFSNGKNETISYSNLKRGDTYCMASARKNKYFK